VLCPDLLFGSKVEGGLRAAGHDVQRFGRADEAHAAAPHADLLVVDLTDPDLDGAGLVAAMKAAGELDRCSTLGFYAHVHPETRKSAEEAGFDRVVPRSRMAREMAALAGALVGV